MYFEKKKFLRIKYFFRQINVIIIIISSPSILNLDNLHRFQERFFVQKEIFNHLIELSKKMMFFDVIFFCFNESVKNFVKWKRKLQQHLLFENFFLKIDKKN